MMQNRISNAKGYLYWLLILICIIGLFSCSRLSVEERCEKDYPYSSTDLPEFISEIWPAPESNLPLHCYKLSNDIAHRGIGVWLKSAFIEVVPVDPDRLPITDRTQLFIDQVPILSDTLVTGSDLMAVSLIDHEGNEYPIGPAGIDMTWLPELGIGTHEAMITVIRNNGEILKYSWDFRITR